TNATCLVSLGMVQMAAHGVDEARPTFRRALEINPGDSYVLADAGVHAIYDGRLDEARTFLDRARRLNPIPPYWFADYEALLDFSEGRFADAARGFGRGGCGKFRMIYILACLSLAGGGPELASALALVRKLEWNLEEVVNAEPFRDPEMRERLREGLRRAFAHQES
ncbi:MAG: tetratricopeptide repeat protein, partial [Alphaproteobacteria bacterium]|nr:tetratricopeptide repeat protein [Alphaproteobacteria bacterium]